MPSPARRSPFLARHYSQHRTERMWSWRLPAPPLDYYFGCPVAHRMWSWRRPGPRCLPMSLQRAPRHVFAAAVRRAKGGGDA